MSTSISIEKLLSLVSDSELDEFAILLGIKPCGNDLRKHLRIEIQGCSRASIVNALLELNGSWISMISDIVQFLDNYEISLRTTGCLIMLPINGKNTSIKLSPQLMKLSAEFDSSVINSKDAASWETLLSDWNKHVNWIRRIVLDSQPKSPKRLNIRKYILGQPLYKKVERINQQAVKDMVALVYTFKYLEEKLAPLQNQPGLENNVRHLVNYVVQTSHQLNYDYHKLKTSSKARAEIHRELNKIRQSKTLASQINILLSNLRVRHGPRADKWIQFVENVLSLAKLESSNEITDLLQLNLLKDRPRLFEVWCMVKILNAYQMCGCSVQLESIKPGEPPIWNLNYARASKPVAQVELLDTKWWLFYQLHQTGPQRDNMPDLAVLKGRDPNSKVMWIADPKFSERRGYSRSNYREVAKRYRDAFNAEHTWICEYFPRNDWFGDLCYENGDKYTLISNVQPNELGTTELLKQIIELHGITYAPFVLAIDCSASFEPMLKTLESRIGLLVNRTSKIVFFGSHSFVTTDPHIFSSSFITEACRKVGGGTSLKSLLNTFDDCNFEIKTELILITDGEFLDYSKELNNSLNDLFTDVKVIGTSEQLDNIIEELALE